MLRNIIRCVVLALSLIPAHELSAQQIVVKRTYFCDTETHAREFAALTLKHNAGDAMRIINEDSYRSTGTLLACGLVVLEAAEPVAIDEIKTGSGTMMLTKIRVIATMDDLDAGMIPSRTSPPDIRYVLQYQAGI